MDITQLRTTSALAWVAGGLLWTVAGLVDGSSLEILWIPADLLLLAGLLTLGRLGLHLATRTGRAGLTVAVLGRVVFVVAEILSLIQDKDQNALLPVGALLSAIGMTMYGVAVLRAHIWTGSGRFVPLVAGLYPFVVMFPLVAANNGDPSETAIALWGLTMALLGVVLFRQTTSGAGTSAPSTAAATAHR